MTGAHRAYFPCFQPQGWKIVCMQFSFLSIHGGRKWDHIYFLSCPRGRKITLTRWENLQPLETYPYYIRLWSGNQKHGLVLGYSRPHSWADRKKNESERGKQGRKEKGEKKWKETRKRKGCPVFLDNNVGKPSWKRCYWWRLPVWDWSTLLERSAQSRQCNATVCTALLSRVTFCRTFISIVPVTLRTLWNVLHDGIITQTAQISIK